MNIGYLGPIGTYCYEACKSYVQNKPNAQIYDFKSISETLMAVITNTIDEAVVPIENSTQGGVLETIDFLIDNLTLYIVDELSLKINHYLLSKCNNLKDIDKIYSHPQAIAQCRNYIIKNFPNIELIETTSNSLAAKRAYEEEKSACIAGKSCSEIYDLNILGSNINDEENNETKFVIISKTESKEVFHNKTSIVFSTRNEPGELYKVLGLFNIFNINLTKIESRPAKTKLGEYNFLLDFIGTKNEAHIKILLEQVKLKCSYFRILGSY